jgi:hypothetical protein
MARQPEGVGAGSDELWEREVSDDERNEIVQELITDMGELFEGYMAGAVSFEDLTFEMYDTLRTLNALSTGDVIIEYEEVDADDEFDEFDELAGEPTGDGSGPNRSKSDSGRTPEPPGHKPRGSR